MKKISKYIFTLIIVGTIIIPTFKIFASTLNPEEPCSYDTSTPPKLKNAPCGEVPKYQLLQPLPNGTSSQTTEIDIKSPNALGDYLNIIIKVVIGLCAVLAVFMIFIGGIEYMTAEIISNKEEGKDRIKHAILGLVLALGAYTLLFTINPDLLNSNLDSLQSVVLDTANEPEPGILGTPGKQITIGTTTITSCKKDEMKTITLFNHSVTVHQSVVQNLAGVDAAWRAIPEANRYKVNSVEGYVCRDVVGKPGYLSAHAFGLAIDINPSKNPIGDKLITDMIPPTTSPSFVQLFTSRGWGWGGNWTSRKDAMHFSKYGEGSNGSLN